MKLQSLSQDVLMKIAEHLVQQDQAVAKQSISALVADESLAKRVVEWLPEAFGCVLISRMPGLTMSATFSARDVNGAWHELPFAAEPLARDGFDLGVQTIASGRMDLFEGLSLRSSVVAAVNSALNSGAVLTGAVISGPAFVSLPAEIYLA